MKSKKAIALMWLLSLLPFVLVALAWPHLPEKVPTHWGVGGQVDAYGSPSTLWLLCAINLPIAAGMQFLPRLDPKKENYVHRRHPVGKPVARPDRRGPGHHADDRSPVYCHRQHDGQGKDQLVHGLPHPLGPLGSRRVEQDPTAGGLGILPFRTGGGGNGPVGAGAASLPGIFCDRLRRDRPDLLYELEVVQE